MWTPGPTELIIILVIVLIIFGAGKLPGIGRALGRGIKEFKDGVSGPSDEPKQKEQKQAEQEDEKQAPE